MKVKFAYYGVNCANFNLRKDVQDRSTQWVARMCNGKSSCQGRVHNGALTDPYRGCHKHFIAVAECSNGQVIAKLVREGHSLSLSCC